MKHIYHTWKPVREKQQKYAWFVYLQSATYSFYESSEMTLNRNKHNYKKKFDQSVKHKSVSCFCFIFNLLSPFSVYFKKE